MYESIALRKLEWEALKNNFTDGWEVHLPSLTDHNGVVYIRKLVSGTPNTESKGWEII